MKIHYLKENHPGVLSQVFLLLAILSGSETAFAAVPLPIETVEGGRYGFNYEGQTAHRAGVAFEFTANGSTLEFSYQGFDIDFTDEVRVHLNGTDLGHMDTTPNNGSGPGSIVLPFSAQVSGVNTLELIQRVPGYKWGITDLLLSSTPNAPGPLLLTIGTTEEERYGYRYQGQNAHRAGVAFEFTANGSALEFSYQGFDIDFPDEVKVRLNGTDLGHMNTTPNKGSGPGSIVLPVSAQVSGTNTLELVQRSPGFIWGVTDLLLSPVPNAPAPLVLTIGTREGERYGYRYQGQNAHRAGVAFEFTANGSALEFSYEGFDIDFPDEVKVRLNGTDLGHMGTTPNNGSGPGSIVLPVSAQVSGTNTLELIQRSPGFIWGITDLLLTPGSPTGGGGGPDIAVLEETGATVTVDQSGSASVQINLQSRQVSSSNVFYVDELSNGNGTQGNPYNDLPDAFARIDADNLSSAIIRVADGDYSWGDAIDPRAGISKGFNASLTVIGEGIGNTRVIQGTSDAAAAVFKEVGKSLYLEGIEFVGQGQGGTSANEDVLEVRNGQDLTLVDVLVRDATDGDGLYVLNFDTVVVYRSEALNNDADGFSYAKVGDNGDPMYVLEVELTATGNGINGRSNSQGSTMHRATEIVRVSGLYANNPTNIEDTGLTSWNVDLTVRDSSVYQSHEGDFVNFRLRGDKLEATDGTAWFISGSYNAGGVVHAHSTTALDGTPIHSFIRYSSVFDKNAHPPGVMFADSNSQVVNPADGTYDDAFNM